ncbi:hypothetical protein B0H15DRAFT_785586 [Mycena belliarum]|uniref:Uncharacterized protein n=1 Tax=Mycena belliarum TaxID=1033014 RepID=A0AAD6XNT0_9AGAR|nr:hypothetical protein B0H15DRAFT_785586 [Mycena belliae]
MTTTPPVQEHSATSTVSTLGISDNSNGNTDDPAPTRTLRMAGGKYITFCESDIPDPPAVSYSKRIEDLLREWDDNRPDWNQTSPLKLNGIPVPLIYWPTIYKYWKGTQWQGVLVRSMSRTTIDEFWAEFSVPDKQGRLQHMKYTPILKQLAATRKADDARLADLARSELTEEQRTYRKGASRFVMTKNSMLAAHYRKLKGLNRDDSDSDEDE